MTEQTREFGLIGLGRMGGSLALQAMEKGYRVVGYTRKGAPEYLTQAGLVEARGASHLRDLLPLNLRPYTFSMEKAKRLLDWTPQVTFEKGIQSCVPYLKEIGLL